MEAVRGATASLNQFVSFALGAEEFGVEIVKVQEIIRSVAITRVPSAPEGVEGVINLRGRIIPVIDLRARLGLERKAADGTTRIIVVEMAQGVIGFVVDRVREVLRIDRSTVEPAPELATSVDAGYVRGVAKLEDRLLILLDLEQVLQDSERSVLAG